MVQSSLHAATDKAVFDAVNQHKITKEEILNMFFSRGVIVSKKTDKDELAKEFSSFFHSYHDYDSLSSILGVNNRKEKLTSYTLDTSLKVSDVESSIKKIKEKIVEQGATVEHKVKKEGKKIELAITYQVLNLSKNDFQQVSVRDAILTIEETDSGLDIQHPQNKKLSDISDELIDVLESKDKSLQKDEIELSAFEKPEDRCQFFDYLTKGVEGFTCKDVTDTYVFNPSKKITSGQKNEVHITSASLKGTGVNLSDELKNLHEQGFYTWRVIWKAVKENKDSSDLYVFEAQFSDAEECKDFSFIVKGSYKRKDEGIVGDVSGHNVNRTPISLIEEEQLNKLINKSAWSAIEKLSASCATEGDENDNTAKQVVSVKN
ncbi:hypothetical protein M3895_002084 [Vibrio parahaemolyticus]|uniref:hypothetical protein n=1 Tax=Vibrio parahaemolyticus TaxID=670 RepID=UPI001FAD1E13|nr:hypothetical protein [Vibrio parahaemolyticus]EJE4166727.1 hypothetical protein [Vibrio parahaemolyticus]MCI9706341.1 hypothetical protein [Vibrio parahaemolyticus]MDF5483216.1 hypothetical protein [Vibrio parahaemolyticus]MDG2839634.1 hypothetical protein [Vibrio parahaemolyticus]